MPVMVVPALIPGPLIGIPLARLLALLTTIVVRLLCIVPVRVSVMFAVAAALIVTIVPAVLTLATVAPVAMPWPNIGVPAAALTGSCTVSVVLPLVTDPMRVKGLNRVSQLISRLPQTS